jgi:Domain of unknown function (DUF1816)
MKGSSVMEMTDNLKELFISFVDTIGVAVWVEIITESPVCTYYFGPFSSIGEAGDAKSGYVEDLEAESAIITSMIIKRCKPQDLTIFNDSFLTDTNHSSRDLILSSMT